MDEREQADEYLRQVRAEVDGQTQLFRNRDDQSYVGDLVDNMVRADPERSRADVEQAVRDLIRLQNRCGHGWSCSCLIWRPFIDPIEAATALDGPTPIVGCLPTGDVNALTLRVPGISSPLIIFDDQLALFLHLMAKSVVQLLPLGTAPDGHPVLRLSPGSIEGHLESHTDGLRRSYEVLLATVLVGTPGGAEPYSLPPDRSGAAIAITTSAEMFAVAHEYGHLVLGHLSRAGTEPRRSRGSRSMPADQAHWRVVQEYEADVAAIQIMLRANRGQRPSSWATGSDWPIQEPFLQLGPQVFMYSMHLLLNAISMVRHGSPLPSHPLDSSHPPPYQRLYHLRKTRDDGSRLRYRRSGRIEVAPEQLDETRLVDRCIDAVFGRIGLFSFRRFRAHHERRDVVHERWIES